MRPAAAVVAVATLLAGIQAAPAQAYPRPGLTQRVNVASDGAQAMAAPGEHPATANSTQPAVSGDGRFVAFASGAPNLVAGDSNGEYDVFVHDRAGGATERVSVASDGTETDGGSFLPAVSADGQFVAFISEASNLVAGDSNERWDVFVHDRASGATERVSVASDGTQANGNSVGALGISPDGSLVAFSSLAANLVAGDTNGAQDVFGHDRVSDTTELVSVSTDGQGANGSSWAPAVSADGRFVAFYSAATNLAAADTDDLEDVYVHDRASGTTELVSVASDGTHGSNSNSTVTNDKRPAISADGRFVAFPSNANNLVPADTNNRWDVFVRDRVAGTTERVSVASDGTQDNGGVGQATLSADGRFVVFNSFGSNLVADDTNAAMDVFVRDRETGVTERVSLASDGTEAAGHSPGVLATSADGRVVGFASPVSNLVAGDTNGATDIFVRDRGTPLGVFPLSVEVGADTLGVSGSATFSGSTLGEAADPDDDGGSVGPSTARDLGAELTGASIVYRPESEDLLVRWEVASFPLTSPPQARLVGNVPGVMYGLAFEADGIRFEVRGLRAAPTSRPSPVPRAALYRCEAVCVEHATLTGSFGSVGEAVWVSLPAAVVPVGESDELASLRAFSTVGEVATGAVDELDDVALPAVTIPSMHVELGVATAATPEEGVAFEHVADLSEGEFAAEVPVTGLPAGTYRVWARACLGDTCGAGVFAEVAL